MRLFVLLFLMSLIAKATPSSTFWAPATANCQAPNSLHITYDSYFNQGPTPGAVNSPGYPTDIGLTQGLKIFENLQSEIGFDVLLPSPEPTSVNAKICLPETFSDISLGIGIYSHGFKKDLNDYDITYIVLQKTLSHNYTLALGGYYGLNKNLFINSDGQIVQSGWLASITGPDININLKNLKKINFVADLQSGKNSFGAWGFGLNSYISTNISLLTGPVFFFDPKLQPGSENVLWTLQLDADLESM